MYYIKKGKRKKKLKDDEQLKDLSGIVMNKKGPFVIADVKILNLTVVDKDLANPLVMDILARKYNLLVRKVTVLLSEDDDSGESYREALNQIERFRLIIKNKYRDYLEEEVLKELAKQLGLMKREANKRLLEIDEFVNEEKIGKGR